VRALVWFRRDLRAADNTALSEACAASDDGVVGVFVISPGEWEAHDDAPVKVEFWLRNLRTLSEALARVNIPLKIVGAKRPNQVAVKLLEVARSCGCDALYFNREYEINEQRRDDAATRHMEKNGATVRAFHDHVVLPPADIRTGSGGFYSVFSPFKKAWLKMVDEVGYEVRPAPKRQSPIDVKPDQVPGAVEGFKSEIDPAMWPAGEH
jgi:deoxyribodipyrimidine photo-lyase